MFSAFVLFFYHVLSNKFNHVGFGTHERSAKDFVRLPKTPSCRAFLSM